MRLLYPTLLLPFILTVSLSAQPMVTDVIVANQGNFTDGNGSITLYNPGTTAVVQGIASDIGSIIQSVHLADNLLYVMANTGAGIDLIDLNTYMRVGQIAGVTNTRYMAHVDGQKRYVTGQFPNIVTVIEGEAIRKTIDVGGTPEGIAGVAGLAYVARGGFGADSTLARIDTATDTLLDLLDVGCGGPRSLAVDAEDEVWVVCTGSDFYDTDFNLVGQTNGQVVVLDGATGAEVDRIAFPYQLGDISKVGQDLFYAPHVQEAYVWAAGPNQVLRFDTRTNTLVDSLQIDSPDTPSALAYDGTAERLYVGHTTSFTTAGYVTIHDRTGTEVGRFEAGIAPVFITLREATDTATERVAGTLPEAFALSTNYPNPFASATTFQFALPQPAAVTLKVYSVLGKEVATLVQDALPAGTYQTRWNAPGLSSGTYLYRLQAGTFTQTRTLTVVR